MTRWLAIGALLVLAGGARAQGSAFDLKPPPLALPLREVLELESASLLVPAAPAHAEVVSGWSLVARVEDDAPVEELAALLAKEPPPVSRETLEGPGEELQRYHALPGGIVLGLRARAAGSELGGARLEGGLASGLGLRLADGRFLRAPAFDAAELATCARFAAQRLDGLVDLASGWGVPPRLAPAVAGSALEPLLVRMDALPHRLLPETRVWKSLIVDRDVRLEVAGEALVLAADLEVRWYGDEAGLARRVLTLDAPADLVGPRMTPDLGAELAPLAEVAGWLGFLRWAAHADPAGFARLVAECEHAPAR